MPAPAQVDLRSDTEIVITRDFAAPRSLVYLAFIKPALVQRWLLGPPGWTMPVCEIDLRVGGDYHYRWREGASGHEFGLRGTFDGIEAERELVSREHFEDTEPAGESHVVTTFEDLGDTTRVTYVITVGSKAAREAAYASGMTDGMEMSFASLDKLLAETPAV